MKKILATLLMSFLLGSCNSQSTIKLVQKAFPKFGVTIAVPENWNYVEGSENMKNKLFKSYYRAPDNNSPYNNVALSLSYEVLKGDAKSDSVFNQVRHILTNQALNHEVIDFPVSKTIGQATKSFKYDFSVSTVKMSSISTYFICNKVLLCLNITVHIDKIEDYKVLLGNILASINVDNIDINSFSDTYNFKKVESRYVNDKYGFEISFPKGWYYVENLMGNVVQVQQNNQNSDEISSMGVNIQQDYDEAMTPLQYNQRIIKIVRKQLLLSNEDELIQSIKFPHPMLETYKAHFKASISGKKEVVFLYTVIRNKQGYLFIAVTDEEHLGINEPIFDDTFKSFSVK